MQTRPGGLHNDEADNENAFDAYADGKMKSPGGLMERLLADLDDRPAHKLVHRALFAILGVRLSGSFDKLTVLL